MNEKTIVYGRIDQPRFADIPFDADQFLAEQAKERQLETLKKGNSPVPAISPGREEDAGKTDRMVNEELNFAEVDR